jgi:thiol-disulfide isomerase/thioredoxin
MRYLSIAVALILLTSCSKPAQQAQPTNNQTAPAPDAGPHKGVDRGHKGQPAPTVSFKNPDGGEIALKNFRGTPVLVNLWASWCAPCVKELPTLDKLAQSHDIDGALGVIAVSQDSGDQSGVVAFLKKLNIKDLGAYHDSGMALSGALGPDTVLPTTILIDANGKEVWRYVGDLDWTSPEAAKLIAEAGASSKS